MTHKELIGHLDKIKAWAGSPVAFNLLDDLMTRIQAEGAGSPAFAPAEAATDLSADDQAAVQAAMETLMGEDLDCGDCCGLSDDDINEIVAEARDELLDDIRYLLAGCTVSFPALD